MTTFRVTRRHRSDVPAGGNSAHDAGYLLLPPRVRARVPAHLKPRRRPERPQTCKAIDSRARVTEPARPGGQETGALQIREHRRELPVGLGVCVDPEPPGDPARLARDEELDSHPRVVPDAVVRPDGAQVDAGPARAVRALVAGRAARLLGPQLVRAPGAAGAPRLPPQRGEVRGASVPDNERAGPGVPVLPVVPRGVHHGRRTGAGRSLRERWCCLARVIGVLIFFYIPYDRAARAGRAALTGSCSANARFLKGCI